MNAGRDEEIVAKVSGLRWLSPETFELRFQRPPGFDFIAGQKISVSLGGISRDYSLVSAPDDHELAICVRLVKSGELSPMLAGAQVEDVFAITPAFGQFLFQSNGRPAVLVATGTGVAPYVAYVRSGIRDFQLLHGVRSLQERYYREDLTANARSYIACIPNADRPAGEPIFGGRVTAYLATRLAPDAYDFYLCGRREMIRDAMGIIDRQFPEARVFTEIFF